MQIHFLRHATFILKLKGVQLLVDPMLSAAGAMDPVKNAANHNQKRIPMVPLPLSDSELSQALGQITGVLVSHNHRDHWDQRARELLPKDIPVLCQPGDETGIRGAGFTTVTPIENEFSWQGITFHRTGGQHGFGEIGQKMGKVSGFVAQVDGEQKIYIAGDTVWCPEVSDALQSHRPDVIVVNAGEARFATGGPITMNAEDAASVCRALPSARVVAVHMEAVNHCVLTREGLRQFLTKENLLEQVLIPADGDILTF